MHKQGQDEYQKKEQNTISLAKFKHTPAGFFHSSVGALRRLNGWVARGRNMKNRREKFH